MPPSPTFQGHRSYQSHHRYDGPNSEDHSRNSPFSPTFQHALGEIQSDESAKSSADQLLDRELDWFTEIQAVLPTITPELRNLSVRIFENPEVGGEERLACQLLSDFLASHDFTIEREPAEMETAFIATYESPHYDEHSKVIGFFAEYDALPELGHACGHNLVAVGSIAAAIATKKVMEKYHIEGLVQVFGSPDEERMGGKIELVEAGYVKYPDVCLMTHPGNHENAFMRTLALQAVSVHYYGKATHAAISPWEGINALDAVVQSYQAIAMHRNQMNPSTQIHGIITDGGQVTNVIPKHASAHYFMRSENKAALKELQQKVTSIFEGVAQTTGCQVRLTWDPMYAEMKVNSLLASQYQRYMERLYQYTFPDLETQREHATGSTDMGNVSQVKPSIHTSYGIGVESRCNLHTDAFRQACQTSVAHEQTWKSATGLALVALRVLDDEEFCDQVAQEFHGQR